jgi:hypothetical protein
VARGRPGLACWLCGTLLLLALALALALAGSLRAASPGWTAAGTLAAGDGPAFAGNGISVAPGGGGRANVFKLYLYREPAP